MSPDAAPLRRGVAVRLSGMMFLQYFMFGSWLVTLGTYMSKGLHFDHVIGTAYGTQGVAAIFSTLVVGVVADRYFAAQKVFAVLALLSALTLFLLAEVRSSSGLFLCVALAHFACFVPTIPLASSIAFNAMTDRNRQFPTVRVFGTLGWIAAGLLVGLLPGSSSTSLPLKIGGCAGIVLALYAWTLPDTPPRATGERGGLRNISGLDLFRKVHDRDFIVFSVCVLLTIIPLAFYNAYCNNFLVEAGATFTLLGYRFEPAAIQTLGQGSELGFMIALPVLTRFFGIKRVLLAGMFAWALRYSLFAIGFGENGSRLGLLVVGVLMHGICYDLFFVASQLYVDARFDATSRTRAQAFLVFINMGVGIIIGSNFANWVYQINTISPVAHRWGIIWSIPAAIAVGVSAAFALLFKGTRPIADDGSASG